jgi:uncharacterized protein (TIGR00369 family)
MTRRVQHKAAVQASRLLASAAVRDLDRWLGDGGMPLIAQLGAAITAYGEGWATAQWRPSPPCCNPAGTVQAGVQSVLLDAVMNFALLASLGPGERCATLEMKISTMRPARAGDDLALRGEVLRLGRRVAYLQAFLRRGEETVTHATATFAVLRPDTAP